MINCKERVVEANEYKDILYNRLFSLVNNILQPIESDTICITDEYIFVFMQDNAPCHKAECILEFLVENSISIMI